MDIEHGRPAGDERVDVLPQLPDIGFPVSQHDVGVRCSTYPRSVARHEPGRNQYLAIRYEEKLRHLTNNAHNMHRERGAVGRTGLIRLVRSVELVPEGAPEWSLADGVL